MLHSVLLPLVRVVRRREHRKPFSFASFHQLIEYHMASATTTTYCNHSLMFVLFPFITNACSMDARLADVQNGAVHSGCVRGRFRVQLVRGVR